MSPMPRKNQSQMSTEHMRHCLSILCPRVPASPPLVSPHPALAPPPAPPTVHPPTLLTIRRRHAADPPDEHAVAPTRAAAIAAVRSWSGPNIAAAAPLRP